MASSSLPVTIDFRSTQRRCRSPAMLELVSGSPPRERTSCCNSAAALAQSWERCIMVVLRSARLRSSAHSRKPFSPSLLVSIRSLSTEIVSFVSISDLLRNRSNGRASARASRSSRLRSRKEGSAAPLYGAHIQFDPGRRMVAGVFLIANPAIHALLFYAGRQVLAEQQVNDAQAGILLPVLTEIVPEGVNALVRVSGAQGIGPALGKQALVALAAFRLQQRVLGPGAWVVDVLVGGHHVVVAGQHHRMAAGEQPFGMLDQPLEPGQLVVEFRSRLRVAVGQVEARDDD